MKIAKKSGIDRREFLRMSVAGLSVAGTYPLFLGRTAAAAREDGQAGDDRILVVLQLSGGNDGLSTVVPYADPAYGRARSTLRLGEKEVLRIDDHVGLHPNLKDLKRLFDDGLMAIVQGTSYPNPTRSHFQAMDIWQAGDRQFVRDHSGWLGRAIDSTCGNRPDPLRAVNVGGNSPLALLGKDSKPVSFSNPESYQWRGKREEEPVFREMNGASGGSGAARELDFLRRVAIDAHESSATIRRAAQAYRPVETYPPGNRLANDLRLVAALIAAGLSTRVYYVSLGGFDTHANQKQNHDNLMRVVSTAVGAFVRDLKANGRLDRVVLLTFSEFGRRVKENGSRGTDHGVAAPMFLLGGKVQGGLHGRHPSLTDLAGGDLAMTVDFRQVYATVLDGWIGVPAEKVLGGKFAPLGLLKSASKEQKARPF